MRHFSYGEGGFNFDQDKDDVITDRVASEKHLDVNSRVLLPRDAMHSADYAAA